MSTKQQTNPTQTIEKFLRLLCLKKKKISTRILYLRVLTHAYTHAHTTWGAMIKKKLLSDRMTFVISDNNNNNDNLIILFPATFYYSLSILSFFFSYKWRPLIRVIKILINPKIFNFLVTNKRKFKFSRVFPFFHRFL